MRKPWHDKKKQISRRGISAGKKLVNEKDSNTFIKPKDESNRFQQLTITKKKLQEFFPVFYTKSQMEKVLFDLLSEWKKQNEEQEG